MLNLFPAGTFDPARLSRRQTLRMMTLAGVAGPAVMGPAVMGSAVLGWGSRGVASTAGKRHARACISIFLCGGPSQPDLWDLKPLAPAGIRSEFAPIATVFLNLVQRADPERGAACGQAGADPVDDAHRQRAWHGHRPFRPGAEAGDSRRRVHRAAGLPRSGRDRAAVPRSARTLAPWIILPRYFGTSSPPYKGQSAGFLGRAYDPVIFDKERKGSLSDARFDVGRTRARRRGRRPTARRATTVDQNPGPAARFTRGFGGVRAVRDGSQSARVRHGARGVSARSRTRPPCGTGMAATSTDNRF